MVLTFGLLRLVALPLVSFDLEFDRLLLDLLLSLDCDLEGLGDGILGDLFSAFGIWAFSCFCWVLNPASPFLIISS